MPTPSRNDPCPCGSGRKYKKCCALAASSAGWTADDREEAFAALYRFLERREWDDLYDIAWSLFWPDDLWDMDDLDEEALDEFIDDPDLMSRFLLWMGVDRVDPEGVRPIDVLLARERHRLTPGSRFFLERLADAPVRLYQIRRVEADRGIEVRDLLDRTTRFVHERLGTRQLVQWDLLAARLTHDGAGRTVIVGPCCLLAPGRKRLLRRELGKLRRHVAELGDDPRIFDTHAALLCHHAWVAANARRPPTIVAPDGEPLVLTKAVYRVGDPSVFRAWIDAQPGVEPEGDSHDCWAWFPDGEPPTAPLVATVRLGPKRIIVLGFSRAALARAQAWLATAPAKLLTALFTREHEMTAPRPAGPLAVAPAAPIDPAVEAEAIAHVLDEHYRTWPDIALPALDGRTPRQAAAERRWRPVLRDLLEEMESRSERGRRTGRSSYDFTWIWAELGLRR